MERRKYPIRAEDYELCEEVGQGVSACVYKARCVPFAEIVAIKIIDFERQNSDLSNISKEAQTLTLIDHPNILSAHCSFVNGHNLWIVMPYMAGGSCLHIIKSAYQDGFEEVVIATFLRETLKGLAYLHEHGHIHRDVKAGNILLDGRGGVKLGDFGVSASVYDSGDRQRERNTFVGTPCWMAPEILEQRRGYDFKADIWSFGITALELAHGHAPFSKFPPMKVLLMTLQSEPPSLNYETDKKFSRAFKQMVAICLLKDPKKRPSANKLLKHSFFRQAKSNDYIRRTLLDHLPPLGDRIRALKTKEEEMLAQKKMPYGEREELSQNEYKRGISGWSFNIDDIKAQAALIGNADEMMGGKEASSSSNSLFELETVHENSSPPRISPSPSFSLKEGNGEITLGKSPSLSIRGEPAPVSREKTIGTDDGYLAGNIKIDHTSQSGKILNETSESEAHEKHPIREHKKEGSNQQSQSSRVGPLNGLSHPGWSFRSTSELTPRGTKLPASNGEEVADEKSKCPVVHQRGRFKALTSLLLQKSQTGQVPQTPEGSEAGCPLNRHLASILQTNVAQRDHILGMMKLLNPGGVSSSGRPANFPDVAERTLAEGGQEREKQLEVEISELQSRLHWAQEELQRLRTRDSR
ncbi:protein kinase superfamily protein isoform X2 [Wolffia australiana]